MKKKFMFTFLTVAMQVAPLAIAHAGDEQVVDLCQVQGRNLGDPGRDRYINELSIVGKGLGENLPGTYEPEDLVSLPMEQMSPAIRQDLIENKRTERVRRNTAIALQKMLMDAAKDNVELVVHSGYRSYKFQCHVFSTKLKNELATTPLTFEQAIASVNTRSAFPGQSEHQMGTVADITTNIPGLGYQLIYQMMDTPAYKWLQDNAYRYGFVMSYPYNPVVAMDQPNPRTGYVFEPWHWRYIHPYYSTKFRNCGDMTLREFLYQLARNAKFSCTK